MKFWYNIILLLLMAVFLSCTCAGVVGALNHMIDEINSGRTVFHDFYSDEQRATGDLVKALTCIVQNSETLGVDSKNYSLWGGSAGARMAGVEVEYRKYQGAGHGFGMGTGTDAEGWVTLAVSFWQKHIF